MTGAFDLKNAFLKIDLYKQHLLKNLIHISKGCVDDDGLFVELGKDILMRNIVHRCYRVAKTTVYHRFACAGQTLAECVSTRPV